MKWLLFSLCLLLSFSAFAENDTPWWKFWKKADDTAHVSDRLFTSKERKVLHEYLRTQGVDLDEEKYERDGRKNKKEKYKKSKKQKSLPPGLQTKVARGGQLPPGWQKKVARGEVLDSELYGASRSLPRGILDQLNNIEGTSVRHIDDRVVRVMDATGVILDVLSGR